MSCIFYFNDNCLTLNNTKIILSYDGLKSIYNDNSLEIKKSKNPNDSEYKNKDISDALYDSFKKAAKPYRGAIKSSDRTPSTTEIWKRLSGAYSKSKPNATSYGLGVVVSKAKNGGYRISAVTRKTRLTNKLLIKIPKSIYSGSREYLSSIYVNNSELFNEIITLLFNEGTISKKEYSKILNNNKHFGTKTFKRIKDY